MITITPTDLNYVLDTLKRVEALIRTQPAGFTGSPQTEGTLLAHLDHSHFVLRMAQLGKYWSQS